jgi:hypothetical protein
LTIDDYRAALAEHLAAIAVEFVGRVRDPMLTPQANATWLRRQLPFPRDQFALLFVLAAAVPEDQPWSELTAWADREPRPKTGQRQRGKRAGAPLQPCGTPAAAKRHRRRGEPVCDECRKAKNRYDRTWAKGPVAA